MKSRLIIDQAVAIPQPSREEVPLEAGEGVDMQSAGEPSLLRRTGPLTKEHGVWVFRAGQPLPASATDEALRQIREERDLANLGLSE